ncbi:MAG: hypothetical protein FWE09_03990 [Treponema sp.]|nr:hypothetical protein [Treponema sp.]
MGKPFTVAIFCLALFSAVLARPAGAATFKEDFYQLYRIHLNRDPDNFIENIYWLERALHARFANPLHALARIETETQWELYRILFEMQINVKLVEQYLFLGNMWNRRSVHFFNAPWRDQNLESLETAETAFIAALYYWDAARELAQAARVARFRFVELPLVQFWTDSAHRIEIGDLNYGRTISRELANIEKMREQLRAMPDPPPRPFVPVSPILWP